MENAVRGAPGLTLVKRLVDSMWQFMFRFALASALAACAVLLAVSALVPVLALRCFHRGCCAEVSRRPSALI